ncbi:DUF2271 domain-containing protein [Acinetobacter dispersus]|uniref:DUF2271 domain-containing protein n=1 Tax=Acinetobacter dispersus TaxID=70348 RepID=UPI001F4B2246|nr:DUF2271 domain-containing protein [Acinetobacter dispersus]MCH7389048.1 DUF2271 domain-containing protein [Acinetobacter dispersus]
MFIKIDAENYINTDHIVAISTFTTLSGKVKISIDTVTVSSGHGPYVVNKSSEDEAIKLLHALVGSIQ